MGSLSVLHLDDDEIISGFYEEVLKRNDCDVTRVHRARDIIEPLTERRYDVLVLDIMFPVDEMLGMNMAQCDDGLLSGIYLPWLLKEKKLPIPPIVYLTNRPVAMMWNHMRDMGIIPSEEYIKSQFEYPPFEFADFLFKTFGK